MGNTPSEPGQPTPPNVHRCPDCEYKGAGEGYADGNVTDIIRNCPVPINGWQWRGGLSDGHYVRHCPKHRAADRAAAEGSDSKMEAPSRTPEQNG